MKCNIKKLSIILLLLQGMFYLSCASSPVNFENSPAWEDLDREPVPEPVEVVENQLWDIMDHTFFYEVVKSRSDQAPSRLHRKRCDPLYPIIDFQLLQQVPAPALCPNLPMRDYFQN